MTGTHGTGTTTFWPPQSPPTSSPSRQWNELLLVRTSLQSASRVAPKAVRICFGCSSLPPGFDREPLISILPPLRINCKTPIKNKNPAVRRIRVCSAAPSFIVLPVKGVFAAGLVRLTRARPLIVGSVLTCPDAVADLASVLPIHNCVSTGHRPQT